MTVPSSDDTGPVGGSPRLREIIQKAASLDANVSIEGELGTGKELVAQSLHMAGPRRDRPFITLDCSTIAEGLIESHLLGHVRGAFTGAVSTRQGVFAQAHTGTLFIKGIDKLSFPSQAKLLRVIETGEFTMVGGDQPQRVNVQARLGVCEWARGESAGAAGVRRARTGDAWRSRGSVPGGNWLRLGCVWRSDPR